MGRVVSYAPTASEQISQSKIHCQLPVTNDDEIGFHGDVIRRSMPRIYIQSTDSQEIPFLTSSRVLCLKESMMHKIRQEAARGISA